MALSKEEMIFKQMTDDIDESLTNQIFFVWNIWNPVDEEILVCTRKIGNSHDNYTVSIMRNL